MMLTDEQYDAPLITLDGMQRQIEIASKSGIEFRVQVAEHYKKSYYDVKVYESERTAEDRYYTKTTIKPRGRKRMIKVDGGVMTVLREQLGEKI